MRAGIGLVAVFVSVILAGCKAGEGETRPAQRRVLSEALLAGGTQTIPDKDIGEDCSANRASSCLSGLCVKTSASLDGGWICTSLCTSDVNCRPGWACKRTLPDPDGRTCLPLNSPDGGVAP